MKLLKRGESLRCGKCEQYKPLEEFCKDKSLKRGYEYLCKKCRKEHRNRSEYMGEYRQRPGVKLKQREHQRKYIQKPENKLQREKFMKKYHQRPDVKLRENKRQKDRFKKQRKTDPMFRLNMNIKVAIRLSLKGNKNGYHWESLVGFTLIELKDHLEKLFTDGMTWNNYGLWHIDHIIPISTFAFAKPEDSQFKQCWDLKNLQPLWAEDNRVKYNKLLRT